MNLFCNKCNRCFSADTVGMQEVKCPNCDNIVTIPKSPTSPGAVFGDFIIKEKLSSGGMGDVFLAHQISLDRPAALKILKPELSNDKEYVDGIFMEARAAAKLNHPHIVQAYAVGEENGTKYFAMEYVKGETYKQILKEKGGKLDFNLAARVIMEIADALNFAWTEQKLVHQDIKPDNIMCAANGSSKLADLGLCRIAGKNIDTDSDEVLGTPQYISPEQLTGVPTDVRSDIYSLGATFYQFITGRFPYVSDNADEIAKMHVEGKLEPPKNVNPKVPDALNRIVLKMMALNIEDRYQTPEPLIEDLRKFLSTEKTTKALPKLSVNMPKPKVPQLKINVPHPTTAPKATVPPPAVTKEVPEQKTPESAIKPAEEKKAEKQELATPEKTKNGKQIFSQLWIKIVLSVVLLLIIAGAVLLILMKRNMLPENISAILNKTVSSTPAKRQQVTKKTSKKTVAPNQKSVKQSTRPEYIKEIMRVMTMPTGTEIEQKNFKAKADVILFNIFSNRETPRTAEEWQAIRALQQKWAAYDEKFVFASKREKFLKQREAKIKLRLSAIAEAEEQKRLQEEKEKELRLKNAEQERKHQEKLVLERQRVLEKQYETVVAQITPLEDKLISSFKESLTQNDEAPLRNAVVQANKWNKPANAGSEKEQKLVSDFLTLRQRLLPELRKCLKIKAVLNKISSQDGISFGFKSTYATIIKVDPGKAVTIKEYNKQEEIEFPLTDRKLCQKLYASLLRFCISDKNLAKMLPKPNDKNVQQKQAEIMEFYFYLIGNNLDKTKLNKAPVGFWEKYGIKFLSQN